jgi:hypothetical protein
MIHCYKYMERSSAALLFFWLEIYGQAITGLAFIDSAQHTLRSCTLLENLHLEIFSSFSAKLNVF